MCVCREGDVSGDPLERLAVTSQDYGVFKGALGDLRRGRNDRGKTDVSQMALILREGLSFARDRILLV